MKNKAIIFILGILMSANLMSQGYQNQGLDFQKTINAIDLGITFYNPSTVRIVKSPQGWKYTKESLSVVVMPLYIKAGSIIPIGPDVQYAEEKKWDQLEIRVYRGANGKFVLYEDEFDNYNYEKGQYSEITFNWNDSSRTLTIDNRKGSYTDMLQQRNFNIKLIEPGKENIIREIAYKGNKVSVKL